MTVRHAKKTLIMDLDASLASSILFPMFLLATLWRFQIARLFLKSQTNFVTFATGHLEEALMPENAFLVKPLP